MSALPLSTEALLKGVRRAGMRRKFAYQMTGSYTCLTISTCQVRELWPGMYLGPKFLLSALAHVGYR
jgi:hypothetical protein